MFLNGIKGLKWVGKTVKDDKRTGRLRVWKLVHAEG
jgi:hypothetical protein